VLMFARVSCNLHSKLDAITVIRVNHIHRKTTGNLQFLGLDRPAIWKRVDLLLHGLTEGSLTTSNWRLFARIQPSTTRVRIIQTAWRSRQSGANSSLPKFPANRNLTGIFKILASENRTCSL